MKMLRRLGVVLWLALALVAGQHAALLHDLGHATELAQKQDSTPVQTQCENCFAFAQLTGPATTVFEVPPVACDTAPLFFIDSSVSAPVALAYRSQAPPALL